MYKLRVHMHKEAMKKLMILHVSRQFFVPADGSLIDLRV